jgi:hypothetical protein
MSRDPPSLQSVVVVVMVMAMVEVMDGVGSRLKLSFELRLKEMSCQYQVLNLIIIQHKIVYQIN